MPPFAYLNTEFYVEDLPLAALAKDFGTPCYVYSLAAIKTAWDSYASAIKKAGHPAQVFYAVKANSTLAILSIFKHLGANFDAVSGGEIERILAVGGTPQQIMFSGVGKSVTEITRAIELGIHCINIESSAELMRVHEIATALNKTANIAFRINPDVQIAGHPYIATGSHANKFGIDYHQALEIYKFAATLSNLKICGISCHIGSQILTTAPFLAAIDNILAIVDGLAALNIHLEFIDVGGGLGVEYANETPPTPAEYIAAIAQKFKGRKEQIHFEPGRSLIAKAGVLLTTVEYLKTTGTNNFAIVDAAMNDLIRPALYHSYHTVIPAQLTTAKSAPKKYDIVGPVCESGDFLALDRELALTAGALLVIKDCGAYGTSMGSNYNTRPRCVEILVAGQQATIIRARETLQQLIQNEMQIDERLIRQ